MSHSKHPLEEYKNGILTTREASAGCRFQLPGFVDERMLIFRLAYLVKRFKEKQNDLFSSAFSWNQNVHSTDHAQPLDPALLKPAILFPAIDMGVAGGVAACFSFRNGQLEA